MKAEHTLAEIGSSTRVGNPGRHFLVLLQISLSVCGSARKRRTWGSLG